jgi:Rrf2 family protein
MLDLKKAGLVKSARGPKGGYRLAREAENISFGEIVRTMEGPIALVSCASVNYYAPCGDCHDEATCAIRRAFTILRDQSTSVLDSISLAEGAGWEQRLGPDK